MQVDPISLTASQEKIILLNFFLPFSTLIYFVNEYEKNALTYPYIPYIFII